MMTSEQISQWCTLFVKGMDTSCIPFTFVMNTFIQSALAMLEIKLNCSDAAGPLLDAICEEQKGRDHGMITELDYPFDASEGWRKKTCLQGAGLMDFTVCGNQGDSSVVSVRMHGMLEKIPVDTVHARCDSLTDCEESSEDCFCADMCQ
jgi:hypothetical protein